MTSGEPAYVGIDVAIAKSKRLPIVVTRRIEGRLEPLRIRDRRDVLPPIGPGNSGIIDADQSVKYAQDAAHYLRRIESVFELKIEHIAIDAPGCYCREGESVRACEASLREARISYYSTPTAREFDNILQAARQHRDRGGDSSRFPFANKLWMNAGFSLFKVLCEDWECLETYPQAVVRELGLTTKKGESGRPRKSLACRATPYWLAAKKTLTTSYSQLRMVTHTTGLMPIFLAGLPACRQSVGVRMAPEPQRESRYQHFLPIPTATRNSAPLVVMS